MRILLLLLFAATIVSCNTTTTKPQTLAQSPATGSDTATIDKSKFDSKWLDDITEMADTDDWVVLSDDEQFTLVQVLTSKTNRHYILYSKDAQFDINGLAWMKIEAPSCLDIHTYNCDVDKLNFSIRDSYSTDFAFEKLHNFLYDKLLKSPTRIEAEQTAVAEKQTLRDQIILKFDEVQFLLDSVSGANNNLELSKKNEVSNLMKDIRTILTKREATLSDLNKAERLVSELDGKVKSIQVNVPD